LKGFRIAIHLIWKQGKIHVLTKRLDSYRQQVAVRLLLSLNSKTETLALHQKGRIEYTNREDEKIVEAISINHRKLEAALESQTSEIKRLSGASTASGEKRHEETLGAILTLRNGQTRSIIRSGGESDVYHHDVCDLTSGFGLTFREGDPNGNFHNDLPFECSNSAETAQSVLNALHFPHETDRFQEVTPAHSETFQWIFGEPEKDLRPWDNFVKWLEHGKEIYWIGGKAGSGKSTLMKYIRKDPRTLKALQKWAGPNKLITGHFFFYNLGSTLQKSQAGLIRTLLLHVLGLHRWLIPIVLPALYRDAARRSTAVLDESSHAELIKGFLKLANLPADLLKICFFIDGIDEYDGDPNELCELLRVVSSSTDLKIVLSSRPIPACYEAFSAYPKLRLQDLTYDDILRYVRTKLTAHAHMQALQTRDANDADQLMTETCSKAQGVFLWVMLVVKSLTRGLQNRNTIPELRDQLEKLPPDLESLYEHMLRTMSEEYRQQASQIYQMLLASFEVQAGQPLTALQLSYAEHGDLNAVIQASVSPLSKDAELEKCQEMEWRLLSRCCGLVEIQEMTSSQELQAHPVLQNRYTSRSYQVVFLHKTVVEFLRKPDNWALIMGLTVGLDFDPNVSLLTSCLREIKGSSPEKVCNDAGLADRIRWVIRHALYYLRITDKITNGLQGAFLDELDKTVCGTADLYHDKSLEPNELHASLLCMTARLGLTQYVS
jgi:hypothetical protein